MYLTKQQRKSLRQLWLRAPKGRTYREFRKDAAPILGCGGAIVVPWCGMWIAVEEDGYAHS